MIKDRKNFPSLVDPYLNNEYPKASLEYAFELASMCTRLEPEKRPPMTVVVKALEYLESQKYNDPNKDTNMVNTKGKGKQIASS